jgi:hypothetical protein
MAQVVEHLPSKCKALSLNPNTAKKERQTEERREGGRTHFSNLFGIKMRKLRELTSV